MRTRCKVKATSMFARETSARTRYAELEHLMMDASNPGSRGANWYAEGHVYIYIDYIHMHMAAATTTTVPQVLQRNRNTHQPQS